MLTQRLTRLDTVVGVLCLLTTAGQCAMLSDLLMTTTAPAPTDSPLTTTQPNNSSMEEPLVLRSHRSCGSEHANYCENGGQCMYPQDNDKPYCICTAAYNGERCHFYSDLSRTLPDIEELIGIGFGITMFILFLGILSCFLCYKRCKKSSPLMKSAPCESSV